MAGLRQAAERYTKGCAKNISIKMIDSNKDKHYDWAVQPEAFFAVAYNICVIILTDTENHKGSLVGKRVFSIFQKDIAHPNYEIVRALIFNIKHGIELYLKCLGIINIGQYNKRHNIEEIMEEFINTFDNKTKIIILNLKNKIWYMIKKYYYGSYTDGDKKYLDKNNISERYPEGGKYDIPDNYKWVTVDKIKEIKNDILILHREFNLALKSIWDNRMEIINY